MMKNLYFLLVILLVSLTLPSPLAAQSVDKPVVQAVLFYSPTCPHCEKVINELLIPMSKSYNHQLMVLAVDTTKPDGAQLYQKAIERYQISSERQGVPTLIIGDKVLVGGDEIPVQFPELVKQHLAAGGLAWPDIPGLAAEIPSSATAPVAQPNQAAASIEDTPPPAAVEPPADPVGMTLATIILVSMLGVVGYAAWRVIMTRPNPLALAEVKSWGVPVLCLFGLLVAIYLAFVEVAQVKAVCGPIGECNIVQTSVYAQLLGVPNAVWGALSYWSILALWGIQKLMTGRLAALSRLALAGLTMFGVLFSIYLTTLEILVIHAVCLWCLSSAVISTVLMLLVALPITKRS